MLRQPEKTFRREACGQHHHVDVTVLCPGFGLLMLRLEPELFDGLSEGFMDEERFHGRAERIAEASNGVVLFREGLEPLRRMEADGKAELSKGDTVIGAHPHAALSCNSLKTTAGSFQQGGEDLS